MRLLVGGTTLFRPAVVPHSERRLTVPTILCVNTYTLDTGTIPNLRVSMLLDHDQSYCFMIKHRESFRVLSSAVKGVICQKLAIPCCENLL
jgi:hypothetical protein